MDWIPPFRAVEGEVSWVYSWCVLSCVWLSCGVCGVCWCCVLVFVWWLLLVPPFGAWWCVWVFVFVGCCVVCVVLFVVLCCWGVYCLGGRGDVMLFCLLLLGVWYG